MQVTARGFEPRSWHICCWPVGICCFHAVGAVCRAQRCYRFVLGSQVCKLKIRCKIRCGGCYVAPVVLCSSFCYVGVAGMAARCVWHRGYGATVARLTPDQKVGSSNLSVLILWSAPGWVQVGAHALCGCTHRYPRWDSNPQSPP